MEHQDEIVAFYREWISNLPEDQQSRALANSWGNDPGKGETENDSEISYLFTRNDRDGEVVL